MARTREELQTCGVCGTDIQCTVSLSAVFAGGSADLDLRPPEDERSTMREWLQECHACRYVAPELFGSPSADNSVVESPGYVRFAASTLLPPVANRFARYALLNADDHQIRGLALLHAAWACDDAKRKDAAKDFRRQSSDALLRLRPFGQSEDGTTLGVILVDILRRARRFQAATDLIRDLRERSGVDSYPPMPAMLDFQLGICRRRDDRRHSISDARPTSGPICFVTDTNALFDYVGKHYSHLFPEDAQQIYYSGDPMFRLRLVLERVLAENAEEIVLNLCPKCDGLTRTLQAKQCLHCGHDWHGG
jgi:hypothetical protein